MAGVSVTAEGATAAAPALRTLDVVHPAHFAGMPHVLVQRGLQSRHGRRLLYRRACRLDPEVFQPRSDGWDDWVPAAPWLAWPRGRLEHFARLLGVTAVGPALRIILQRDKVLFLRRVAGEEAWRLMQAHDPWDGPAPETVRHLGSALLRRAGTDAAALADAFVRRGTIEFVGHADRTAPLLARRLRLAFAGDVDASCARECWLPAPAVDRLVAECHERWQAEEAPRPQEDAS